MNALLDRPVTEGELTGIADGAITGWITSADAAGGEAFAAADFQLVVDGEPKFTVRAAIRAQAGRAGFIIPVPPELRDGRVRYLDVLAPGGAGVLAGGPLVFDGGMFDALRREAEAPSQGMPAEGRVRAEASGVLKGHAWSPLAPERRIEIEVWAGNRLLTSVVADEALEGDETVGDGQHGFTVDLPRLLKGGPHRISVHASGSGQPLDGGELEVGPFSRDGQVPSPGYLDTEHDIALVSGQPFEHLVYDSVRVSGARLTPRLINRLRRERNALAGAPGAVALILLDAEHDKDLAGQLWRRQSYAKYSIHLRPESPDAVREVARKAAYVFFTRDGDILHPSAGAMVMADRTADAVVWNRFCADERRPGSPGVLQRRPDFDPITWRHGAVTDATIAVKGAVLEECPDAVLEALCAGRLHPLYFWMAGQGLAWRTIPEALTVRVGPPTALARREIEADLELYAEILAREGERHALLPTPEDHPFPYFLMPTRRARKTSVVVCYRDKPELTLRCLHSISRQHLTGELEVVLVDNQSSPAAAKRIGEGARRMLGPERVVLQSYDAPFNHSAENNLGARAASGEVVVICNNDVLLQEPTLLEQLGAWALEPSIGAVGCRLDNPQRGGGSYGHVFTPLGDDPFRSPMQESDDPAYSRFVHSCPGVTLALGAMSRERFLAAGGLDEVDFPIGYNDMEFMLRCAAQGMRHLYIGHVHALHARGSSRSGENEDRQTLLVNQRYPGAAAARFRQLAEERLTGQAGPRTPAEARRPQQAAPAELTAVLEARRELEAHRKRLAEAVRRARDLSRKLDQELAAAGATALGD